MTGHDHSYDCEDFHKILGFQAIPFHPVLRAATLTSIELCLGTRSFTYELLDIWAKPGAEQPTRNCVKLVPDDCEIILEMSGCVAEKACAGLQNCTGLHMAPIRKACTPT